MRTYPFALGVPHRNRFSYHGSVAMTMGAG
jgi:hypothetical protein